MKWILRPYQKQARDFLLSSGVGGCLFMEMRLGKTLIAVRYVLRLLWVFAGGKILIVGPNSVFIGWITDIKKEGYKVIQVKGTPKQKEAALARKGTFYILNKEGYAKGHRVFDIDKGSKLGISRKLLLQARKLHKAGDKVAYKLLEKGSAPILENVGLTSFPLKTVWVPLDGLLETKWLCVILDESHFIKNPKSGVSKFFAKNFLDVPYKVCLTGTPMEENEMDFIQQYLFVLGDKLPFDYWKFRTIFTRQVRHQTFIGKKGMEILSELAQSIAFSLRRKDVDMDKEKIFEVHTVKLPAAARKIYHQLEEEFVLEYKEERRITKFIIERFTIMRRICGGFIPNKPDPETETGKKRLPDFIHGAKVKELITILDENFRKEPVVIFAQYIAELDLIYKELTAKGFKCGQIDGRVKIGKARWKIQNDFTNGKFDKLIVQPSSVKEGTDLSVASTSIYYSLPSGYITWKQTQDRILKLSKEGSLLLIILEVEDSLEVGMWEKVENKTKKEDLILSILHEKSFH